MNQCAINLNSIGKNVCNAGIVSCGNSVDCIVDTSSVFFGCRFPQVENGIFMGENMLQVQNLTITQKRDNHILLENLSFCLNDGEKAALIGEEGNGKSTVLKWIYDPSLVEAYADAEGTVKTDSLLGFLPQELSKDDASQPIADWMEAACDLSRLPIRNVIRVLCELGLEHDLLYETRTMKTLSGGERIKLQLASLLLRECDVLLLDEPSNDLDLAAITWLETFLQHTEKTVLYVSHDETLLERTANQLIHIELVRRKQIPRVTVARMPYRQYIDDRERRFSHQRQIADFEHSEFRKKKERYLSVYQAVEHAQNNVSRSDPGTGRLLKKKMHTVQALGKRLEKEYEQLTERPEAEWAILPKFEEGVFVKNGKTILDDRRDQLIADGKILARKIHLRIVGPERIAIIGQNGCGKTTLLKAIAKELEGRKDLSVGYMPQNYEDALFAGYSPVEFLAPNGDKESVTRARLYLGSMKYTTEEMEHPVSDLSGGQRAKILLLRMILDRNNVLLLDEPTRNFSPLSAPAVREMLRSFQGAILAVTHDRKFLQEVATSVYELQETGLKLISRKE